MKDANELRQALKGYTGSELIYRHNLVSSFNYTEGARAFFQSAGRGAYWLSDILATEPNVQKGVQVHGFCLAVLHVPPKDVLTPSAARAKLTVARDGSEQHNSADQTTGFNFSDIVYERTFDYTDCPEGFWKFYLTWTEVGDAPVVLCMLPSEY